MMSEEQDYDVVLDTLQQKIDVFWKITHGNMNIGLMNIMDDIRLEQIDQLKEAQRLWKEHKEKKNG